MNIQRVIIVSILIINIVGCGLKSKKNTSQEKNIVEEKIEFVSQNDTMVGYLSKPNGIKRFPVVVVLHSASHGHHDNDIYNHLENHLTQNGIGVFTYDRRGSGESTGNFNTASLETLAKDALNAIEKLKKRNDINIEKIGLFGISQGGWLAPLAFSMNTNDISFMVLVSSSGVSPAKQMEYSAISILKINGYSNEIIDKAKYLRNITNEYYRGHRKRETTQTEIDKYREEPWFQDVYLPWRGNLPEDVSVTKWIHEMDFNPIEYFETVTIPIILFYGETDRWVPPTESIKIWKNSLNKVQNKQFEVYKIKETGHMMILNEDNNPTQEIISDEYTRILKNWAEKYINSNTTYLKSVVSTHLFFLIYCNQS